MRRWWIVLEIGAGLATARLVSTFDRSAAAFEPIAPRTADEARVAWRGYALAPEGTYVELAVENGTSAPIHIVTG